MTSSIIMSRRADIGLWLARMALRLTGNRALANASRVLPLIPQRRLLICVRPVDLSLFESISAGTWALWKSEGPDLPQCPESK